MSLSATERFGARCAPEGLALVQELVNTHAVARDGFDLLAKHDTAELWLHGAAKEWGRLRGVQAPDLVLSEPDLQALRELRDDVKEILEMSPEHRNLASLEAAHRGVPRAQTQLVTNRAGQVVMIPLGANSSWLASAVWSEILLAQHSGAWARLKLCREPGCRTAFYDASRNGSGSWHNVRTCGNIANLQASRTRRKQRSQTS